MQTGKTQGLFWKGLTFQRKKTSEKIMGKEKNAGNQHVFLFCKCLKSIPKIKPQFPNYIYIVICKFFEFGQVLTLSQISPCFYVFTCSTCLLQENIDALHQWRCKSVVSEMEHITAGLYTEYSNRVTL